MIHQLVMEGYRGFPRYTLSNLSRVNLLVGKNNSGKSSILEAVQLLADGNDPWTLESIGRRRGETISLPIDPERSTTSRFVELSHFFHGHTIGPGSRFSLERDHGLGARRFHIAAIDDGLPEDLEESAADLRTAASEELLLLGITSEGSCKIAWDAPASKGVLLYEGGTIGPARASRNPLATRVPGRQDALSSLFVPPDSLDRVHLSKMWDRIIIDGDEGDVVQAMQILEPDLTSIAFLSGERSSASDPRGGIVVGFRGEPQRRPLGSYGEGMRRLLTMAVALARTKNGVLLIDEVDTGLHYSILGDVWSLIVETAVRNNVQVFLTTHSLDSLRALGWFCGARPDLAGEVSVQKIERRLDEAVALDASKIQIAVEQDIEVR